jgi:hypothetical protein
MAKQAPGPRLATICVLVAAVAVVVVELIEPVELPTWVRLLLASLAVTAAAVFGIFLLLDLFRRLPDGVQGIVTRVIRFVVVLGAAALVVVAVVVGEAPSWLRWVFVVAAVVIVLAGQQWPRVAWPDVAVVAALGLAVFALVAQSAFEPKAAPPKKFVVFELPAAKVRALEGVATGDKVVLLVVKGLRASEDDPVSYESVRYDAVSDDAVASGAQQSPVRVQIERGESDAGATKFSGDLVAARTIYLLSG